MAHPNEEHVFKQYNPVEDAKNKAELNKGLADIMENKMAKGEAGTVKVSEIGQMIGSIAGQTNLLALNAAKHFKVQILVKNMICYMVNMKTFGYLDAFIMNEV